MGARAVAGPANLSYSQVSQSGPSAALSESSASGLRRWCIEPASVCLVCGASEAASSCGRMRQAVPRPRGARLIDSEALSTATLGYSQERKSEERAMASTTGPAPKIERKVFCVKLQKELPGLDETPFDNPLGQRIYDHVSKEAWRMWGGQGEEISDEG